MMTDSQTLLDSVARLERRVLTDVTERAKADAHFERFLNDYRKAVREHAFAQAAERIADIRL